MAKAIEPQRDERGNITAGRSRPEKVRETIERFVIPYIGDRYIVEVTEREVSEIIEHIIGLRTKRAPAGARTTAIHTLYHMKQMWKWARATGRFTVGTVRYVNPIADMSPSLFQLRMKKRSRVATNEEIRIIWDLLTTPSGNGRPVVSEVVGLAYRLLILLGLRTQELRLNTWDNVCWGDKDGEGATLTVPVKLQKGSVAERETFREWVVPLPPTAVVILRRLQALTPKGSPWILTSPKHPTSPVERTTLPATLFDIAKKGLLPTPDGRGSWVRPHDLRRTFRTNITRLTSSAIAERCLNHVLPSMEAVYNQHDYLGERREALEKWEAELMKIVHPDGAGNVVPLAKRAG
jgi:integrase